ncbi:Putative pentatricopeptide repeat-containing protein, partial [Frankliniella fusca]
MASVQFSNSTLLHTCKFNKESRVYIGCPTFFCLTSGFLRPSLLHVSFCPTSFCPTWQSGCHSYFSVRPRFLRPQRTVRVEVRVACYPLRCSSIVRPKTFPQIRKSAWIFSDLVYTGKMEKEYVSWLEHAAKKWYNTSNSIFLKDIFLKIEKL